MSSGWTFGPTRRSAWPPRGPAWSTGRSTGSTRWSTRSSRRSFGPTGRSAWPSRRPTRPTGRTFGSTRWAFGAPTGGFFVGRLCRLLISCSHPLLRSAVRTEVGGFVRKLRAALRTEVGPFVGEFRATVSAEVGGFVGELHAAVGTKRLFFATPLGQCRLPSPSLYLSSGTRLDLVLHELQLKNSSILDSTLDQEAKVGLFVTVTLTVLPSIS